MLKRLLVLILIDVIVLGLAVQALHPDPSVSVAIFIYGPAVLLLNILVALVLRLFNSRWAGLVGLNAVMAPILFYFLFNAAIRREAEDRYKSYYFRRDGRSYELGMDVINGAFRDSCAFCFYQRTAGSSMGTGTDGYYLVRADTIVLVSRDGRRMRMVHLRRLLDYPEPGSSVPLHADWATLAEE